MTVKELIAELMDHVGKVNHSLDDEVLIEGDDKTLYRVTMGSGSFGDPVWERYVVLKRELN